jgi:16S rRNA (uracil1498-N3)-methyltransferase
MRQAAARTAPRFHVPSRLAPGATLDLPERPARHVQVLRLGEGDAITLFDGSGGEYAAVLGTVRKDRVVARLGAFRDIERESPLDVTLALGVSAGDRMDVAIQKATELGASTFVPLTTERSVVRLSGERAEKRMAHWEGVAIAACEQCGRNRVPAISAPTGFADWLGAALDRDLGARVMLAPDGEQGLRALLAGLEPARGITLLVGSEGGLSPQEAALAARAGFTGVRFGPRVMRTETVPLAVLAALQALAGDCQ